ncbi:MAG: hypothetical protein AAF696_03875, partial [Bacteroidota bacterium]
SPEHSWIRLSNPDGYKHGGGHRVKKIEMFDNWDQMSGSDGQSYGQIYDYTIGDDNGSGRKISSGVASYEPMTGDDENPFYKQKTFEVRNPLSPDDVHALPAPILSSFYPAPNVVYSQVKVSDLDKAGVTGRKRGYTISQYYTAKDYPVITSETRIEKEILAPTFSKLFNLFDHVTVSQGYAIKLNNMHGQAKAQWVYGEGKNSPISGVEYKYRSKTIATDDGQKQVLDNDLVSVINRKNNAGLLTKETIGREIDFVLDARQHKTNTLGVGASGNLDAFILAIFPGAIISAFPFSLNEQRRFRSLVTMKTIHLSGLLEEVVAHDGNAEVSTFNEAYDAETGEVLLTKTVNEFNDEVYSLSYPAHWPYDQMGQAYINQGMSWEGSNLNLNDYAEHFVKGDKLLLTDVNESSTVAWVLDKGTNDVSIIDKNGALLASNNNDYVYVKIIESGRSNQQAIAVGSVISKENPIPANPGVNDQLTFNKVLTASAVVFSDEWQMQCGVPASETRCACDPVSPEAVDLQELLGDLLRSKQLFQGDIDISNHPNFTAALAQAAIPTPNSGCTPTLRASLPGSQNNCATSQIIIEIGEKCGGAFNSSTSITLNAPASNQYCLEGMTDFLRIIPIVPQGNACQESSDFRLKGYFDFCSPGTNEIVQFTGNISSFPVRKCSTFLEFFSQCQEPGTVINPYRNGIRGNWAPVETFTYLTGRSFTASNGPAQAEPLMDIDLREQGILETFNPFWNYNTSSDLWEAPANPSNTPWRSTSTLTKRLPQGLDIESKDALGNYSSVQYGQYLRLPVAVAANARSNEIAYANFELASDFGPECHVHFDLKENSAGLNLSDITSHTGYKSAEIGTASTLELATILLSECTDQASTSGAYEVDDCDCVGNFKPSKGKKYRLALWVQGEKYLNPGTSSNPVFNYDELTLSFGLGSGINILSEKRGKLVEGWMPVELIFDIPSTANNFILNIENTDASGKLYIDDMVIHPFHANVQTWVYDPDTQWLLAAGDAVNYYKIYQYDKSGALTNVKQESERGIITTQAGRSQIANQKN